jgi:hypothetical protein
MADDQIDVRDHLFRDIGVVVEPQNDRHVRPEDRAAERRLLALDIVELQTEYIGGVVKVTPIPVPPTGELVSLYHRAAALACAQIGEPFGLIALEAMAACTPCGWSSFWPSIVHQPCAKTRLGGSIPAEKKRVLRRFLEEHADRISGLIPVDPGKPRESCAKMEEWIRDGPCGIRSCPKEPRHPDAAGHDPDVWTGCGSQERRARIAEVAHMYPACWIGSRAVALMGNTHAPLVSLAVRLTGNHQGHQAPGAFIDPFHASSVAN